MNFTPRPPTEPFRPRLPFQFINPHENLRVGGSKSTVVVSEHDDERVGEFHRSSFKLKQRCRTVHILEAQPID